MTTFLIILHAFCAILIMVVILMQSGRGGGLTEAFQSAETIFGPKTNIFMVRATVALAGVFLTTSLVLAHLSSRRESSLIPEKSVIHSQLPLVNAVLPKAAEPAGEKSQ